MTRYIDADRIDGNQVTVYDYTDQKWVHIWEIPTSDAVEVVRCEECESWGLNAIKKDEKGEVIYGDCLNLCLATPKRFYCAWGERKEDETD